MNANRRQSKKRSTVLKNSSQQIRVHLRLFAVELNSYVALTTLSRAILEQRTI
jgi:hypothetical protein